MTAKECITVRRSIRQYTDQPVSHELLAQIVETASYAPSWKHTQIVRYIAVEGEKKAKLAACTSSFPGNGKIMENAPMVVASFYLIVFAMAGTLWMLAPKGWPLRYVGALCWFPLFLSVFL